MEDAATAEISRAQVWQWLHHGARLDDGRVVDRTLFELALREELARARAALGPASAAAGHLDAARDLFERLVLGAHCADFLTLPAYERLLAPSH